MSTQQQPGSSTTREGKRAQFTEGAPAKSSRGVLIAALVLAVGGAIVYFALGSSGDKPTVIAQAPVADSAPPPDELRVSVNEVSGGKAKFFDYKLAGNQEVRFFVVKSSEGDYRAALDACEVCAHAKKGYHQEGDDMVCNNCGKRFPTALIGKISGGCHPIGIPARVDGGNVVISKSELESGAKYF